MTDNLPDLRDIHLPAQDISIWPLAGGWWGLLCVIIGIAVLIKISSWLRRKSAKLYAEHLLKSIENQTDLAAAVKISEILRRACVRQYPQAVALSGDEWIAFLNNHAHKKIKAPLTELLKNVPFMPDGSVSPSPQQIKKLWTFCKDWIGENL